MKQSTLKYLSMIFLASVMAACGGGGGGGGGDDDRGARNTAPVVRVVFPPASSVTDSDSIVVRGTARDAESDGITRLQVNGVNAVSSDGFATWQATVPLTFGVNSLVVDIADSQQSVDRTAASVSVNRQAEFLSDLGLGIFDPVGQQILMIDDRLLALFAMDAGSGERRLISSEERGSGPRLPNPSSIALDIGGSCVAVLAGATRCALLINDNVKTVLAIDLDTGNRAVLSGPERGIGPEFGLVQRITTDANTDCSAVLPAAINCALITDRSSRALFAVDLDTGDRAVVSSATRGTGPNFVNPTTITLDTDNVCANVMAGAVNCVLVVNFSGDSVFAVDMATGNRAVLSGGSRGAGPNFVFPEALVLDVSNSCAAVLQGTTRCGLVVEGNNGQPAQLLAVDLETGDRAILSNRERGLGPDFGAPDAIMLHVINGFALMTDRNYDALLTVNLSSGDRGFFPDHRAGDGKDMALPVALLPVSSDVCNAALNDVSRCAITVDANGGAILAIDLDTGNRVVIASNERGTGVEFSFPRAITLADEVLCSSLLSGATHCGIVADAGLRALLLVDLGAGDRVLLSGETLGSGPALSFPLGIALSQDCGGSEQCALVLDLDRLALFRVNLQTGDRVIISDDDTGSGPTFQLPTSVLVLEDCNTFLSGADHCALITDLDARAVLAVDLQTGNRAVVSSGSSFVANRGNGPALEGPMAMVLANNARCANVINAASRCLLVSNAAGELGDAGVLIAVDIDTGNRGLSLDDNAGNGPALPLSLAFFIDEAFNLGVSLDPNFRALQVLDLVTGERVITAWSGRKEVVAFRED
ncbi:MAG: hypothetical protein R3F38_14110 [Gammaproteobacteria bacterium]